MEFSFKKKENYIFINNRKVEFPYPIDKVLDSHGLAIVLLDIPNEISYFDNVFAVNEFGEIVWRIESAQHKYNRNDVTPYVLLSVDAENKLRVADWYGIGYFIDPKTGKIKGKFLTK